MRLPLVMSAAIRKGTPESVTILVIVIEPVFRNVSDLSAVESTAAVLAAGPLSKTATCHPPARKFDACNVDTGVMPGIDCEAVIIMPPETFIFQSVGVPSIESGKASVSVPKSPIASDHG